MYRRQVHGQLNSKEIEEKMISFHANEIDVLVCSTIIESGIDIPNANTLIVEEADKLGLAQLHQLRGRVGRGEHKSYCLLVAEEKNELFSENNKSANDRLKIMESTTDGFVLAEKDLQLRGPGDFLGTRQTGFSFQLANLSDMALIQLTLNEAETLLNKDPELSMPEHSLLANIIFNNAQNYMTKRS